MAAGTATGGPQVSHTRPREESEATHPPAQSLPQLSLHPAHGCQLQIAVKGVLRFFRIEGLIGSRGKKCFKSFQQIQKAHFLALLSDPALLLSLGTQNTRFILMARLNKWSLKVMVTLLFSRNC